MTKEIKQIKIKQINITALLSQMAVRWPSNFVSRGKIEEFTGGLMTGKTIIGFEVEGQGPPKVKCGRRVGYPKYELVQWLKGRIRTVD